MATTAGLAAADYYVSTTGSDGNAGTDPAVPWRTIARVNALDLLAGDRIHCKRGDTFSDAGLVFTDRDTGTAADPIIVDGYGDHGSRPTIQPPPGHHGISICNTAGLTIDGLTLVGPGDALADANQKHGVWAFCDRTDGAKLAGLRLVDLDISGFYEGIQLGAWHSSFSGFLAPLVSGGRIHDCLANGITTYGYLPGSATSQSHRDITIVDCEVTGCLGDPTLSDPLHQHSGNGIIVSGTIGGLVDRCTAHHNGGGAGDDLGGGPVGIWVWNCDGVIIDHCLVYGQRTTPGALDGGGFDIDGGATACVIQRCHSYGNDGAGFMACEYAGSAPLQNATFRYNVSWKDGRRQVNHMAGGLHLYNGGNSATDCQGIRFHHNVVVSDGAVGGPGILYQDGPMRGVAIHDNLVITTGGAALLSIPANTAGFTIVGNLWWSVDGTPMWRWGDTTYTALEAWRSAPGAPETHADRPTGRYADPLLPEALAGSGITTAAQIPTMTSFRPLAGSPAYQAGLGLALDEVGPGTPIHQDLAGSSIPPATRAVGAYAQP